MKLSPRFKEALLWASELHVNQHRKGTKVPYISHLMAVSSLVLEHGGNEDQAIAALLHDAVEDQGGRKTLDQIRARFGNTVAGIVDECTDTYVEPRPDWRPRKEKYIANIPNKSPQALLVSAADKVHNARAILNDYRTHGEDLWGRFNGKKEGTLWYYRSLVNAFEAVGSNGLTQELARVVDELEEAAKRT